MSRERERDTSFGESFFSPTRHPPPACCPRLCAALVSLTTSKLLPWSTLVRRPNGRSHAHYFGTPGLPTGLTSRLLCSRPCLPPRSKLEGLRFRLELGGSTLHGCSQSVRATACKKEIDREGLRVEVPESPIPIILGIGDIGRELTGKLEVTSQIQRACLRLPPLGLASLAEWRASCERAAHLGCWCRTSR